ncbi:MAG: Rieske (2Fe-2S) protein [Gemmatimonadales bacterium]|jgi:nitrite reductase/ring-hydroxylating ferredoxin subunit
MGDSMERDVTASTDEETRGIGFNEILLGAVIALTVTLVAIVMISYVLPGERLTIPELQPAARVAREAGFPVGASRLVRWGARVILVVRAEPDRYFALEGTSPRDGCILEWEEAASRVVSPCSYVVYDLHGNVVTGLTTAPLARFPVFVRDGTVFVRGS